MGLVKRGAGKARRLWDVARQGGFQTAAEEARKNLWSTTVAFGLRRDLSIPWEDLTAAVEVSVRPLEEKDLHYVLDPSHGDSPKQLVRQRRLVDAGLGTCWVAANPDDEAMYMQWLITPADNVRMRDAFGTEFPPLKPDEVLLEGAFAPRRHRGAGVGAAAVCKIMRQAPSEARWIWTYVAADNHQTLKIIPILGFEKARLRTSTWRMLWHSTRFEELDPVMAEA